MSGQEIATITGADGLTPEWLTGALGLDGVVTACGLSPVGTGQVADTIRIQLTWDPPAAGPATVVAKVTAADDASRNTAVLTRTYELEAAFYRELASTLPVRTPRCYHAAYDPETVGYVILMDDLAPARQGDQIAGCTVAEAEAALDELVRLHAPRWDDPTLADIPWLHRHLDPGAIDGAAMLVSMMADGFLERYEAPLDPDVAALIGRLMPRVAAHLGDRPSPWTVQHCDYRLDNLLFGPPAPGSELPTVTVVDWQTVAHGPGLADLSYFLGAGLTLDDRRAYEKQLVGRYADAMAAAGVDLSFDVCWEGYRRHAFAGLIMAIGASMLVTRTDRGDDMFMAMANRHGRHALDVDAEALIPA